jgi:catechol 2,3-dioxygenase-like lactoylglutathione lyase family enzyme
VTVTAIDHILVLSDDIDATRDFYCRALGLTVGPRPPLEFPGYWLFGADGPCVHIADRVVYNERARDLGLGTADEGVPGRIDHVAFAATDYSAAAERLERDGIAAIANVVPDAAMRQLFFSDPGGVRIEVNVVERDAAASRGG